MDEYRQKNKKKQSQKREGDLVNQQSVFNCQQTWSGNGSEKMRSHRCIDYGSPNGLVQYVTMLHVNCLAISM